MAPTRTSGAAKQQATRKKTAAKQAPAKNAAKKAPAKNAAKQAPAKNAARQAPAKQAPAKQAAGEAGTGEADRGEAGTAKQTAAKQAPAKQAPAKQTAAKRARAKQAPAKQAPAKQTGTKAADAGAGDSSRRNAAEVADMIPKPRGKTRDGIVYTKDFNVKFLGDQRHALQAERDRLLGQATRLEQEAKSLIEEGETGDVQFDDESGEGDTMVVEREHDLVISAEARQTVLEIDAALARIKQGSYGYSVDVRQADPKPASRRSRGRPSWWRRRLEGSGGDERAGSPLRRATGDRRRHRPHRSTHQALGAQHPRRRPARSTCSGHCGSTWRSTPAWRSLAAAGSDR